MANVIIKSGERRENEAFVLQSFNRNAGEAKRADREAAECIAARSREVYDELKRMEERR